MRKVSETSTGKEGVVVVMDGNDESVGRKRQLTTATRVIRANQRSLLTPDQPVLHPRGRHHLLHRCDGDDCVHPADQDEGGGRRWGRRPCEPGRRCCGDSHTSMRRG